MQAAEPQEPTRRASGRRTKEAGVVHGGGKLALKTVR